MAEPMQLSLDTLAVEDRQVVRASGEIDVYTAPALREHLIALVQGGHYDLVVDLDDVRFIDSTGLGVLVGIVKRVRTHSGSVNLVCTRDPILKILRITGLTRVLPIHDTVAEAVAASAAA